MKNWEVQPLIEPMLAPAKTGAVDRSGSALEFIIEVTAAMDDAGILTGRTGSHLKIFDT